MILPRLLLTRHPRVVLGVLAALVVVAGAWGWSLPSHLSNRPGDFYAHPSESLRALQELESGRKRRGGGPPDVAVIVNGDPVTAGVQTSEKFAEMDQVGAVRVGYASRDNHASLLFGWLRRDLSEGDAAADVAQVLERRPGVLVGGPALTKRWLSEGTGRDLRQAELIAFPLLVLLGLWIFRGVIAALLPVAIGGSVLLIAFGCLRLAVEFAPLSVFCLSIASALALGLAVDYSLLMVSRFREELAGDASEQEAAVMTVRTAGKTVAVSSVTIASAFSCLLLIPVPFVRSIGAGGALVALIAGAVALLMLPALFQLLGYRINTLSIRKSREDRAEGKAFHGAWAHLARFVMRRPVLIAAVTGTFMMLLALPALGMRFTAFDETALSTDSAQRIFSERLQNEFEHPLVDELRIAIKHPEEKVPVLRRKVQLVAKGSGLAVPFPATFALGPHLSESRFSPIPSTYSPPAQDLVDLLRAIGGPIAVGGRTAAYMDLTESLKHQALRAFLALVLCLLPLLLLATRSVVLFVKVLVMNVLTLSAAFGLMVVIFQGGLLESLFGYRSQHALVIALPAVMLVGCFGLVTDYGLFLLMRIREERETGRSDRDAIAIGLEKTGPIITAAAVLFSVAVAAFISSDVILVKEVAVGIIAAVLLDAFVVRPLLIPSLMVILGRWNWWPFGMSPSVSLPKLSEPDTGPALPLPPSPPQP